MRWPHLGGLFQPTTPQWLVVVDIISIVIARQACLFQFLTLYSNHFTANTLEQSRQRSQVPSSYFITVAPLPRKFTAPSHLAVSTTALYPLGFYFVFLISRHPPPVFFHYGPIISTKETKTGKWSGHNQQRLKHAHKFPKATVKSLKNRHQTGGR